MTSFYNALADCGVRAKGVESVQRQTHPDVAFVWLNVGDLHMETKEWQLALRSYLKSLSALRMIREMLYTGLDQRGWQERFCLGEKASSMTVNFACIRAPEHSQSLIDTLEEALLSIALSKFTVIWAVQTAGQEKLREFLKTLERFNLQVGISLPRSNTMIGRIVEPPSFQS